MTRHLGSTVGVLLQCFWLSEARSSLFGFGGYGQSLSPLGIDVNSKKWEDAVAASNATGTFSIPGYNVSEPWPGSAIDGWAITITAVDLSKQLEDPAVGYDIKVTAPKSLYTTDDSDHATNVDTNDDWIFCGWRWEPAGSINDKTSLLSGDGVEARSDGSCEQLVSDKCVQALEDEAQSAYSMNASQRESLFDDTESGYQPRATCNNLKIPSSCEGLALSRTDLWGWSNTDIPIAFLNGSTTWQDGFKLNDSTEPYASFWLQNLTQNYQPIVTLFGRYNKDPNAAVKPGFAKMSCIRPSPATNASSTGSNGSGGGDSSKTQDDGGAAERSGFSQWQLFVIAIAMCCWV